MLFRSAVRLPRRPQKPWFHFGEPASWSSVQFWFEMVRDVEQFGLVMAIQIASQVDIVPDRLPCHSMVQRRDTLERTMRNRVRLTPTAFLLLFLLVFLTSSGGSQNQTDNSPTSGSQLQPKSNVVYVCACMKTRSCSCMTEAKMEGPCACGTEGGPPLKAVPKDSDWAKENRAALAK